MKTKTILGQPSWRVASSHVQAHLTQLGGHLGPMTFRVGGRKIQPYSVAPGAEEKVDPALPSMLRVLRGDFFCMPFGGNATPYGKEQHPPHGDTANLKWKAKSVKAQQGVTQFHARLKTKVRHGRVDKWVRLVDGQSVVYQQHVVSAMSGRMNYGHHAMLKFPAESGSGLLATSPFVYGQVFPGEFENPEEGGYQSLKPGALFRSLAAVPMLNGESADLTRYPARLGFEDLAIIVADDRVPFAWSAVTFPQQRYVWFALKDPQVLRETVFWCSNRGRHMPPWSSRHVSVLGVEEVMGCFHYGLAQSVDKKNPLAKRGFQTCANLNPKKPLVVNYIMAVAAIPRGVDHVKSITAVPGGVELRSVSGKKVRAKVDVGFLAAAAL